MNELSTNVKTVTTKELAETLGVSVETIRTAARKLIAPSKSIWRVVNGGKSQVFNEEQATVIKLELQNHSKVAKNGYDTLSISNDLEMLLIQQKLNQYQSMRIEELTKQNELLKPKAEIYDRIANSEGCFTINTTAKALKLPYGNKTLFEKLRNIGVLNTDNSPKQEQINAGHFKVIVKTIPNIGNKPVTLTTSKGLVYLAKKVNTEIDKSVMPDV